MHVGEAEPSYFGQGNVIKCIKQNKHTHKKKTPTKKETQASKIISNLPPADKISVPFTSCNSLTNNKQQGKALLRQKGTISYRA